MTIIDFYENRKPYFKIFLIYFDFIIYTFIYIWQNWSSKLELSKNNDLLKFSAI